VSLPDGAVAQVGEAQLTGLLAHPGEEVEREGQVARSADVALHQPTLRER